MPTLSDMERERLLFQYIRALDRGDADAIASVLETALDDPKLDQAIGEVDRSLLLEAGIPSATDAATVAETAERTLGSASDEAASSASAITAGDVAARLKSFNRIPRGQEATNDRLLTSSASLPDALSLRVVFQFLKRIEEDVGKKYAQVFREAALWIRTSRSSPQVKMAARNDRNRSTPSEDQEKSSEEGSE